MDSVYDGVSNLEVAAEGEREALPATPDEKKRKHPGRQTLPANLPRVERVIACTAEQCVCGGCGQSTTVIGYEESEQLDVEPVKYFVPVTRREKRACKSCEERGVMAAPLPPRIIEKSLVSERVGGTKMVHAACWAHSRRRFVDATKLNQQDVASTRIVAQMAKLFAIDAQARDENMDHAARHALRLERAPLVLRELKAQIEAASRTALPSSPLGKTSAYTLRLWDKLTRFLDYPELELSNNLAENSMRPVAIGRRNWTHIGHQKAGPRVAAIAEKLNRRKGGWKRDVRFPRFAKDGSYRVDRHHP